MTTKTRPYSRRRVIKRPNNITGLLSQSVRRSHQMRRQRDGWDACVCDADVCKAVDAEVCVDHAALFAGEHGTGGGGVEFRARL